MGARTPWIAALSVLLLAVLVALVVRRGGTRDGFIAKKMHLIDSGARMDGPQARALTAPSFT
jgi:hypothetical protein